MLTNDNLIEERPHDPFIGGVQRLYRFKDGHGLSVVNGKALHAYFFAWEIAVIKWNDNKFELDYTTELTGDVEVFSTDEEANNFIRRAKELFDV